LAQTPRKEVFIYVHGYHNSFQDAALATAELWHFLGREGVPLFYTWPAGYPGIFGYTYDRESSEFTVFHFKNLLRYLASFPEVENVHIIAHSRGTDVVTAGLRELIIEARASGHNPRDKLKVKNLVLAAPDLDVQVVEQRWIAEKFGLGVERLTVYTSPADKAIGISETLFSSPRGRIGTFDLSEVSSAQAAVLKKRPPTNTAFVAYSGAAGGIGHSYYRTDPTASSDLILMLRYDLDPGDPGRPLEHVGAIFWKIPPGYPDPDAP
jgi:esterase/lipase superfamily enzyme